MPRYIKTEGIILKRRNFKDTDKMITVLTRDIGKLTARARGIRKVTSKKKSHLELLNYTNLYLVEGKVWYVITQAEAIKTFSSIKKDLKSIQWAYYIAEVTEKLIPENEEDTDLFYLIRNTLSVFDSTGNPFTILSGNMKALILAGFISEKSILKSPFSNDLQLLVNTKLTSINNTRFKATTEDLYTIVKELTEDTIELPIKTRIDFT